MNAGKNHLLKAFLCQMANFLQAVLFLTTSDSSPNIGDNTIGAKLITAVLHLYKGSALVLRLGKEEIFVLSLLPYRGKWLHGACIIFQHSLPIGLNQLYHPAFSGVSDKNINALILFQLHLLSFHIAAGGNDDGLRIPLLGLMNHLPGFPVRNIGYGAGINQVNVRLLRKIYKPCSFLQNSFGHGLCFIRIDFAA